MAIESINPANGKLLQTYDEMSASEVDAIIERAHRAHLDWRDSAFSGLVSLARRRPAGHDQELRIGGPMGQ